MLYGVLRVLARLALRWFYRDIEVSGLDRLPRHGPVLLAGNHPNALVDALVIGTVVPRPIVLTAKATLLDHPLTRALVKAVGIVPLRRVSDVRARPGGSTDPGRNEASFAQVLDALAGGAAVLLFPEGRSHDEPSLGELRTGLARLAFRARDERALADLRLVAIGLTYEAKWRPRSRVAVTIAEPFSVDASLANDADGVTALTARVDRALRSVTLNFPSTDDAQRVLTIARLLSGVFAREVRSLPAADAPLTDVIDRARRVEEVRRHLDVLAPADGDRVRQFVDRLDAFHAECERHGVLVDDLGVSLDRRLALWFVVRESAIALVALPLSLWGRLNHWIPLRLARWHALRSSTNLDEPAMRTIVAGLALVLVFYGIIVALVWWLFGAMWAALYLISLPVSATWDFAYGDRRRRAIGRARTNLVFRRDPELRERLRSEALWLRDEAAAIETRLGSLRGVAA